MKINEQIPISDMLIVVVWALIIFAGLLVPSIICMVFRDGGIGLFLSRKYWATIAGGTLPWLIALPVVPFVAGKIVGNDGSAAALIAALMLVLVSFLATSILSVYHPAETALVGFLTTLKFSGITMLVIYGFFAGLELLSRGVQKT